MNLDHVILAALASFAAIGFYTGAIQQVSQWIGIIAAYFGAKPVAALAAPVLAKSMGWPPALTAVGVSVAAMPVILIVATLAARGLLNALIPGPQRNRPDRIAGIFLGAGKAAVIAWVALAAVLAFEKPLTRALPGAKDALHASSAVAFTRRHSLFDTGALSVLEKLGALAAKRDNPALARDLLENPALRSLLNDPALKRALAGGDASALRDNPRLKELLADPELVKQIESMQIEGR